MARRVQRVSARMRLVLASVGTVVVVLVVGGLIAAALNVSADAGTGTNVAVVTPSTDLVEVPSTVVETPKVGAATRVLAAFDGTTAWRSSTGNCPDNAAIIERTADAGATWAGFDLTTTSGYSAAQTMDAPNANTLEMVAFAATSCTPRFVSSVDNGVTWTSSIDALAEAWYVNPADRSLVQTPEGPRAVPCTAVIALASNDTNAAILCSDETVYRTTNNGFSWGTGLEIPGAVAVAATGDGYLVATTGSAECAGVQVSSLVKKVSSTVLSPLGCKPVALAAGEIALSVAPGGQVWMWAGEYTGISADGGVTWP